MILQISASQVARITDMSTSAQLQPALFVMKWSTIENRVCTRPGSRSKSKLGEVVHTCDRSYSNQNTPLMRDVTEQH
jgi:hypothetical protein